MCKQIDPSSIRDALAALQAGLRYLATADPAALTGCELAACLRDLAATESAHVAARAAVLDAFENSGACADDGQISARAWLRWQTQITGAAAGHAVAWSRRLKSHTDIAAALGAGQISPSYARELCDWTDRLPAESHADADQILLAAAAAGADLADLAGLAEEIRRRVAQPDSDDAADPFEGRWLRLTPHYKDHARLDGELTPQAAAAVRAVLDALGKKTGPEDDRTQAQRDHDTMEEACRRLVGGGLPDRAGQPTSIHLTMTLQDLLGLPGAGAALATWDASGAPAPAGSDCDAAIEPIVTGHLDLDVLRELRPLGPAAECRGSSATTEMAARAVAQLTVGQAAGLLSGPGGLASWLRTHQFAGPAASISLPLDVGAATETIPPHMRRAVIRRDQHCRFPGCAQPAAGCHVHHLIPRSEGGTTSLENCALFCTFHHLIAIHRWGWIVTLNADGTSTAIHPHQPWRILHSHAPPTAA